MSLKTKIGALSAAGAFALGMGVAAAPAAQAGELCDTTGVCGEITNWSTSPRSLPVTCALQRGDAGGRADTNPTWQSNHDSPFPYYHEVPRGEKDRCKDADGFHVPWGYYGMMFEPTRYNTKYRVEYNHSPNHWVKVTDVERVGVILYKYPMGQGPQRCCGD